MKRKTSTTTRRSPKSTAIKRTAPKRTAINPENYTDVTVSLRDRLQTRAPVNYERGRDRMRDHLVDALQVTPTRARHIVSTLVQKGYVRFGPHPNYHNDHTVGCWTYHPNANKG